MAGHSAGGHLAASVLSDILGTGTHNHIAGAVLISGVFELGPIARCYVNDLARISVAEVNDLSLLRRRPAASKPVHILIGADEPEAFQVQSEVLGAKWSAGLPHLTSDVAAHRDHFDVVEELNDPLSPKVQAILPNAKD